MSKKGFRLTVEKGPKQGSKIRLKSDRLIIGSSDEADIVIPVASVDPLHASLSFEGQRLILSDLGSREGTFRNGQRLLGPLQVFPGDRIGLGLEVELVLDGPDTAAQRVEDEEGELDTGFAGTEPG